MGYTTSFDGHFQLDRPLSPEHAAYLTTFSETRRMKRNAILTEKLSDPVRKAAGLDVGRDGGYYVGGNERSGVVDGNGPPQGQPGLWCQWVPIADNDDLYTMIGWDGNEKFDSYTQWLRYLVDNFLGPWGYKLNGESKWSGEEDSDRGILSCKDNVVKERKLKVVEVDEGPHEFQVSLGTRPKIPSVKLVNLKTKIRDALVLYSDGPKNYLRFAPLETSTFRHGISLNVLVTDKNVGEVKNEVAEYLAAALSHLAK